MADSGIKKVTVLSDNLPTINNNVGGYAVRYRIISDDKNRVSHWSPTYYISAQNESSSLLPNISKTGFAVSVVWDKVSIKKDDVVIGKVNNYDVWIKWGKSGQGDWLFYDRVQTNSLTTLIPTTYFKDGIDQAQAPNQLSVEIYLEGTPILRDSVKNTLAYSVYNHSV